MIGWTPHPPPMKSELALCGPEEIAACIMVVRGQRVLLDADLARIYGVPAKRLNEQVKRNQRRFPEDFMFQLTREEAQRISLLRSQNATLKKSHKTDISRMHIEQDNPMAAKGRQHSPDIIGPCAKIVAQLLIPIVAFGFMDDTVFPAAQKACRAVVPLADVGGKPTKSDVILLKHKDCRRSFRRCADACDCREKSSWGGSGRTRLHDCGGSDRTAPDTGRTGCANRRTRKTPVHLPAGRHPKSDLAHAHRLGLKASFAQRSRAREGTEKPVYSGNVPNAVHASTEPRIYGEI